jgi:hypothetical protein
MNHPPANPVNSHADAVPSRPANPPGTDPRGPTRHVVARRVVDNPREDDAAATRVARQQGGHHVAKLHPEKSRHRKRSRRFSRNNRLLRRKSPQQLAFRPVPSRKAPARNAIRDAVHPGVVGAADETDPPVSAAATTSPRNACPMPRRVAVPARTAAEPRARGRRIPRKLLHRRRPANKPDTHRSSRQNRSLRQALQLHSYPGTTDRLRTRARIARHHQPFPR